MSTWKTQKNLLTKGDEYNKYYQTFRGVDFSSEQSTTDDSRLPFAVNVYRDYQSGQGECIETIPGFRERFKVSGETGKVNGIHRYQYEDSGGNERSKILLHIGTHIYLWRSYPYDENGAEITARVTLPEESETDADTGIKTFLITGDDLPHEHMASVRGTYTDGTTLPTTWTGANSTVTGEFVATTVKVQSTSLSEGDDVFIIYREGLAQTQTNALFADASDRESHSFMMNNRLYILDGTNYLTYDGTNITRAENGAYVPTTAVTYINTQTETDESEARNLLSPYFKEEVQILSSSGKIRSYESYSPADEVTSVKVYGTEVLGSGTTAADPVVPQTITETALTSAGASATYANLPDPMQVKALYEQDVDSSSTTDNLYLYYKDSSNAWQKLTDSSHTSTDAERTMQRLGFNFESSLAGSGANYTKSSSTYYKSTATTGTKAQISNTSGNKTVTYSKTFSGTGDNIPQYTDSTIYLAPDEASGTPGLTGTRTSQTMDFSATVTVTGTGDIFKFSSTSDYLTDYSNQRIVRLKANDGTVCYLFQPKWSAGYGAVVTVITDVTDSYYGNYADNDDLTDVAFPEWEETSLAKLTYDDYFYFNDVSYTDSALKSAYPYMSVLPITSLTYHGSYTNYPYKYRYTAVPVLTSSVQVSLTGASFVSVNASSRRDVSVDASTGAINLTYPSSATIDTGVYANSLVSAVSSVGTLTSTTLSNIVSTGYSTYQLTQYNETAKWTCSSGQAIADISDTVAGLGTTGTVYGKVKYTSDGTKFYIVNTYTDGLDKAIYSVSCTVSSTTITLPFSLGRITLHTAFSGDYSYVPLALSQGTAVTTGYFELESTITASQSVSASGGTVTFTSPILYDGEETEPALVVTYKKPITTVSGIQADSSSDDMQNLVAGCTMCTVFDNRIFVSGNPKYPNHIFWSGYNSTGYMDPTYFPENNYQQDGVTKSNIMGLIPVGDSLMVIKESSDSEGTIFYHTGQTTGTDTLTKVYPSTQGIPGIGCVSSCINFLDDPVFLSKYGLEGIGSLSVKLERALEHRSTMVDARMCNLDLTDAKMTEFGGYLVIGVGEYYFLADSRSVFTNAKGQTEYEWFYLNDIGIYEGQSASATLGYQTGGTLSPSCYVKGIRTEQEDNLFFGTMGGSVCSFNFDQRRADGTFPSSAYDFNGRTYLSGIVTKLDNCGIPHLTKTTVKKSLVIKVKTMDSSAVHVKVRTNRDAYSEISNFSASRFSFDATDFEDLSFNVQQEGLFAIKEKEKKWVEKQFYLYSEGFRKPLAIHYIAYRYRVAGKYKNT